MKGSNKEGFEAGIQYYRDEKQARKEGRGGKSSSQRKRERRMEEVRKGEREGDLHKRRGSQRRSEMPTHQNGGIESLG